MKNLYTSTLTIGLLAACATFAGCATTGNKDLYRTDPVRYVRCVYSNRPWVSVDRAGDRDPEAIWYWVFLQTGDQRSVIRDGTFHIEMYHLTRTADHKPVRTLASDWHYPTTDVATIKEPGMWGPGYVLQIYWASKELAGEEVEFVTTYEDPDGRLVRGTTKPFRIPKYVK